MKNKYFICILFAFIFETLFVYNDRFVTAEAIFGLWRMNLTADRQKINLAVISRCKKTSNTGVHHSGGYKNYCLTYTHTYIQHTQTQETNEPKLVWNWTKFSRTTMEFNTPAMNIMNKYIFVYTCMYICIYCGMTLATSSIDFCACSRCAWFPHPQGWHIKNTSRIAYTQQQTYVSYLYVDE